MADPTLTDEELAENEEYYGMEGTTWFDPDVPRLVAELRVSREYLHIANEAAFALLATAADLGREIEKIRRPVPTAAEVTEMVDETAKAEMRRQGRDPEMWDRLPNEVRDQLRLLALDRLRSLS